MGAEAKIIAVYHPANEEESFAVGKNNVSKITVHPLGIVVSRIHEATDYNGLTEDRIYTLQLPNNQYVIARDVGPANE